MKIMSKIAEETIVAHQGATYKRKVVDKKDSYTIQWWGSCHPDHAEMAGGVYPGSEMPSGSRLEAMFQHLVNPPEETLSGLTWGEIKKKIDNHVLDHEVADYIDIHPESVNDVVPRKQRSGAFKVIDQ